MTTHHARLLLGSVLATTALVIGASAGSAQAPVPPLTIDTARITIAGTSNVHAYTASTTNARVTRAQFAATAAGGTFWNDLQSPGRLEVFDLTIPVVSLTSPKGDLEENLRKALKATEHPDITFSLTKLDGGPGAVIASGTLRVAGVAREVTFPIKTVRNGDNLTVTGVLDVLMPDYGIAPPKAMLGMIKAGPGIKITFDVLIAVPTT
jgi:polyisoprenoid-binding protein YceI